MAVRFDADGEDYTRSLALGSQTTFTVCCWARLAVDRNSWQTLWSLDNGTGDVDVLQTTQDGTTLQFYADGTMPAIVSMAVGTWYFVAISRAGTSGNAYHRTASTAMTTVAQNGASSSTSMATFRLGESPFGAEWLNGSLAAVKVWVGVALTAAEIAAEAERYQPVRVAGLTAYYPLVRPETTDYSGNGRTLSGGTGTTREDGPSIPWSGGRPRLILPAASSGITGSGTLTPAAARLAGLGTATVTGSGAATAPPAATSGTGTVAVSGSGAATAATATITGTGQVTVDGSGQATAPPATAFGSGNAGEPAITGNGAASAPATSVSGSGTVEATGAGTVAPPAAAVAGTGRVTVDGDGTLVTPTALITGAGGVTITGAGQMLAPAAVVSGAELDPLAGWPPTAGPPSPRRLASAGAPVTRGASAGPPRTILGATAGAPR